MHKSGYIAIVGQPNVGKSTLLNALLGQKLAAVSAKPQMTREKILGIKTIPGAQMMFLDTPGIHRPRKSLNKTMVEAARESFHDADVLVVMIDPQVGAHGHAPLQGDDAEVLRLAREHGKPLIVAINKIDTVDRRQLLPLIDRCLKEFGASVVIPISAKLASGLDRLEAEILERLPEGPVYFPEDQVTDRSERFLVEEIVREKIMDLTRQEVPYGTAVMVESFQEPQEDDRKKVARIQAVIIVEKDSQKGILIGKGGQMIKQIGETARKELETMLGVAIYLELFVKVDKDWTEDPRKVQEFTHQPD
ncbi:MAG TPA: GTPase Era [bacterium]|nr:GTPase Era [bacterium]